MPGRRPLRISTAAFLVSGACASGARPELVPQRPQSLPADGAALEEQIALGKTAAGDVTLVDYRPSATASLPGVTFGDGRLVLLEHEALKNEGWVAATPARGGRDIVAVLDSKVEAPGWALHVVSSGDGGKTWALRGELRKVYYMAELSLFEMSPLGEGRIVLRLDDDYGGGNAPGCYQYATSDGGATWGRAVFGGACPRRKP